MINPYEFLFNFCEDDEGKRARKALKIKTSHATYAPDKHIRTSSTIALAEEEKHEEPDAKEDA